MDALSGWELSRYLETVCPGIPLVWENFTRERWRSPNKKNSTFTSAFAGYVKNIGILEEASAVVAVKTAYSEPLYSGYLIIMYLSPGLDERA